MDADTKKIIEKLENVSHTNERSIFLNQNISGKGLRLKNLNLKDQLFRRCNFNATEFYNCSFQNCEFLSCEFTSTSLSDVQFLNCSLIDCDFSNAKLENVTVEDGIKSNCTFKNLKIINNVNGIGENESNIISDATLNSESFTDKLTKLYNDLPFETSSDFWKLVLNNIELCIGLEPEGFWRIMIGREVGPNIEDYESIRSVTVDQNIKINELHETILDTISSALNNVEDQQAAKEIKNLLNMFNSINVINENNSNLINKTIELNDNEIDMLEQISSALNHVENNMLDDMVLGEISNLLKKYEEFMNNKIRN